MEFRFEVILGVAIALFIVVFAAFAILKSEKTNIFKRFFSNAKDLFDDDPSRTEFEENSGKIPDTLVNKTVTNTNEFWMIRAIEIKTGGILGEGNFDRGFFEVDKYAYRERHYTIGRDKDKNFLVIGGTYTTVSGQHAYIRYNREDGEYYYWDNCSKNRTFIEDGSDRVVLPEDHIKVTDGLRLYIGNEVCLEFFQKGSGKVQGEAE